jgi:hypothetical protein
MNKFSQLKIHLCTIHGYSIFIYSRASMKKTLYYFIDVYFIFGCNKITSRKPHCKQLCSRLQNMNNIILKNKFISTKKKPSFNIQM